MVSIQTRAHIDKNGRLDVELPAEYRDTSVNVTITLEPEETNKSGQEVERDANGWRIGFLDRMYGIQADDPIERLPQGEVEVRETID